MEIQIAVFGTQIEEVLNIANLTDHEKRLIDLTQPFDQWSNAENITIRLSANYANLLDTLIEDEEEDYLLWHAVDVISTYADPALEPDVEHLCIGILILEGVASDIASANWDALVEKAITRLSGDQPSIVVCVRPEDFREPELRARLLKFHGCAVRAAEDEAVFRLDLVGRQTQINGWVDRPKNAVMLERLVGLVATKPTLMLGLSAQDANIQAIFSGAQAQMAWRWPGERPSYVFSEDRLGIDQRALLRIVYRQDFDVHSRNEIMESALVRAYAKPLLLSLVLQVLCVKLKKLIHLAPGPMGNAEREALEIGVIAIRNQLALSAAADPLAFLNAFIFRSHRIITLFREGRTPDLPQMYTPISNYPVHLFAGEPTLRALGLREAAVAIGILGVGLRNGAWTLEALQMEEHGVIVRIVSALGCANVYFAANSHVALWLLHEGYLEGDDDIVVIHSLKIVRALQRSPQGAPGRTGRVGLREVSISELMDEAQSHLELVQRFRQEVAV